ncbi:hypothetical protein CP556_13645 [Natrinema sp. CBA1119]|uniref:hypothetical protein n=1 Tax=Natrinema sp. CBA1119 TaxID=1608465 RepID=UPI000BF409A5|nr:hypothetical protein [Natrinema sp. CBA1119]PGF17059.1 hypothetical protein CP556_13645 [Natrinema sp. CBA1119]
MSEPDRLKARIIDELEQNRHTHASLRHVLSEEYGYSDAAVSAAISALNDEGKIKHEQGVFELTDD